MELETNKTPRLIIIIAVIVVGFLVYCVADANYNMLLRISQEKLIGQQDPFLLKDGAIKNSEIIRLYNTFSIGEKVKAMAKALGYSLATFLVLVYYKNIAIKIFFALLDSAIVFIYLNKSFDIWWRYDSYVYSVYTGLILIFVGLMGTDLIKEIMNRTEKEPNSKYKQLELLITEYQTNVGQWFENIVKRFDDLNLKVKKQELSQDIERKIAARKQKLRRDNQDWRNDSEIEQLIKDKENL